MASLIGDAHAVVIGSGMSGLVAAAELAQSMARVTLIDRDAIAETPADRNGVPQSWHFHGLLAGGLEVMMKLFPGFDDDLAAAGSLRPSPEEFYAYTAEGKSYSIMRFQPEPSAPPPGFPPMYIQSRRLLERCLRNRVEQVPNITTRYECMVRELAIDNGEIVGVIDADGKTIEADLVIDATGRVSRTLGWLDKLGYERPEESHIHCEFAYTSLFLRPNDPSKFTDVGFFVGTHPEGEYRNRGGALVRMEDGLMLGMIAGRFGDQPPSTYEGYLEYAKTLIEPRFHELISDAEPLGDPHHFRFPKSIRRHYERLDRFPEGLLPIGDAISHNNPVYGQCMSSAAQQAQSLGELVSARAAAGDSLSGLWRDYFPAVYEVTRAPWLFAALADFARPECTGDFPAEEQSSVELLMRLSELGDEGNAEAALVLANVGSLRAPLSAIHEFAG